MTNIIHFEPIIPESYNSYVEVGTKAYNQHYTHLWPAKNSEPYINNSFTQQVLRNEAKDDNTILYRILKNSTPIGILKITLNAAYSSYTKEEALYVDKIYMLNKYSRIGIGKKVLQFVMLRAKELNKKIVWLDTMQKGPAKEFYLKNGFEIDAQSKVTFPTVIQSESFMWVMVKKV